MKIGTVYIGKQENKEILFSRVWAMPNHETFKIKPIKTLLDRYVGKGGNWVDPFAGANSPAKMTNDHDPKMQTIFHMDALEFAKSINHKWGFEGTLFDPPYSFTQIKEHYQNLFSRKLKGDEHLMGFYEKVKSELCDKIKPGGYAISFGWNSNGFGKARGFKIIEIMIVAHGGSKNDTIVTVEQKMAS